MAIIIPSFKKPTVTAATATQAEARDPRPATSAPIAQEIRQAAPIPSVATAIPSALQPDVAVDVTSKRQAEVPASQLDLAIASQLETLTAKIEAQIPDVRQEMMIIHKALSKDPAQVTILSQEQCAILFAGYSKLSGMELVAKAAAKKGGKAKDVTVDMFE